jgi:hypothetical protein
LEHTRGEFEFERWFENDHNQPQITNQRSNTQTMVELRDELEGIDGSEEKRLER